jgi:membrane peptidoglycan carboxypeptidase
LRGAARTHVAAAFLSAEDRRFTTTAAVTWPELPERHGKTFARAASNRAAPRLLSRSSSRPCCLARKKTHRIGLSDERIRTERSLQKYSRKVKELILAVRLERS